MSSLPTTFSMGSFSSAYSVRDAIASYRRSQYLVAGSKVTTATDADSLSDDENNVLFRGFGAHGATENHEEDDLDQHDWDEEISYSPVAKVVTRATPVFPKNQTKRRDESTPLLRKSISFPSQSYSNPPFERTATNAVPEASSVNSPAPGAFTRRRFSGSSHLRTSHSGQSTFGQSLFNAIAILLGIGMLSDPFAFARSGLVPGTILIFGFGFISCYTAKILAHTMLSDPRLRSYADIGRKAFGQSSMPFISFLFCFELFSVSVILVTLYADSLHSLVPNYSTVTFKLWGLVLLIPSVFLPLSFISYTSILGILSSTLIIFVVIIDGLSKTDAPGSLWVPAETSIAIVKPQSLGLAIGLFMAGFAGHTVIPSLARDMEDPSQFDRMINWAFLVATTLYALIGYAGYLMFGSSVSEEISMDLMKTAGYNPDLNKLTLWLLVISPLSKFALTTQPLNVSIEILLGMDIPLSAPEDMARKHNGMSTSLHGPHVILRKIYSVCQRIAITMLSVTVSIVVPQFGASMALLGAFAAFLLCLIGPLCAKIALARRCSLKDGILLALSVIMAVWGTIAAGIDAL